jgi:hypothetical protein
MKAEAAKNRPDPKEPKGPRARSDDGRFVGVRVNVRLRFIIALPKPSQAFKPCDTPSSAGGVEEVTVKGIGKYPDAPHARQHPLSHDQSASSS